jgi:CheY-like chemotaxis protein
MSENPTVLVIDDEQVVLDSARRILASEGFPVAVADDAESALSMLESEPVDIVISDLMLPGRSGIEFMEEVHRQDPNLVVIITTGYSTVENGVACLRKGAFEFLPKPFTFEELLSPVDRARRYLELPLSERVQLSDADAGECYVLGTESWARVREDGSGMLGLTELFLRTVDRIESIEFPDVGGEVRQGGRLVRCVAANKLVHDVWSPLTGRVLEVNVGPARGPEVDAGTPQSLRWLVRVLPADLEKELLNLSRP